MEPKRPADLPVTVEKWSDGTFLIHDNKRIAKKRSDFVHRMVEGVRQTSWRLPDDQWKPLIPGVRVTTGGTGCDRHDITVTFDTAPAVSVSHECEAPRETRKEPPMKVEAFDPAKFSEEEDGITAEMVRRRAFLRCAADCEGKAMQKAGLRDAKANEIDEEIIRTLSAVATAWANLLDEMKRCRSEVR